MFSVVDLILILINVLLAAQRQAC